MAEFFTSDHHFGHANIIKYCKRPFVNVNQMDAALIYNWNVVVKSDDLVWVVGDFTMMGQNNIHNIEKILAKLNGRKKLVLGNHDRLRPFEYVEIGFESVHTSYEHPAGFYMVHDPAIACGLLDKPFIVGHVHGLYRECNNTLNVGVDVNGFAPVHEAEVQRFLNEFRQKHVQA